MLDVEKLVNSPRTSFEHTHPVSSLSSLLQLVHLHCEDPGFGAGRMLRSHTSHLHCTPPTLKTTPNKTLPPFLSLCGGSGCPAVVGLCILSHINGQLANLTCWHAQSILCQLWLYFVVSCKVGNGDNDGLDPYWLLLCTVSKAVINPFTVLCVVRFCLPFALSSFVSPSSLLLFSGIDSRAMQMLFFMQLFLPLSGPAWYLRLGNWPVSQLQEQHVWLVCDLKSFNVCRFHGDSAD